ncbi:MAG: DUF429 domain-containing protein [Chloroflexota bacterium]|nr:DUF429 domain-containing protein [Chloroflexota bacterium]
MQVVGVDGCPGGWIAVVWDTDTDGWQPQRHNDFRDIVTSYPDAACIGIDIPIGLRDDGRARGCDVAARALLGWPRGASVFPAPQRRLLEHSSYNEASARSRADFGNGISRQAFGIYRKVSEVDGSITPDLQHRIVEVHPEVSFWAMNCNRPVAPSKKTEPGFEVRRNLLADHLPFAIPETRNAARKRAPFASADDLLDALAVVWTARRHASGQSRRLWAEPAIDAHGIRMQIVV